MIDDYLNSYTISNCQLFNNTNDLVQKFIANNLKIEISIINEVVIYQHDFGDKMYIIIEG